MDKDDENMDTGEDDPDAERIHLWGELTTCKLVAPLSKKDKKQAKANKAEISGQINSKVDGHENESGLATLSGGPTNPNHLNPKI